MLHLNKLSYPQLKHDHNLNEPIRLLQRQARLRSRTRALGKRRIRCMSKVTYESPDKGKTIYARENGTLNKVLIKKP